VASSPEPAGRHVVAVVVTWNRRDLLAESLCATLGQTRAPDRVLVVDNAGGAGGFALGIREVLAAEPGALLWLMDDDTVPEPTALEALVDARAAYPGPAPALVASRVVWTDARDHPMNTPRRRPWAGRAERERAAGIGCVPIRSASFVSVLVDGSVVRDRGLPIADYFLWNDDFEFTTRVVRGNAGIFCPASVVVHKTVGFASTDTEPGERFFYEVRNKVWLFTRSTGLSPFEKLVYGGRSGLRWASTIVRSRDRGPLLRCLVRGLALGLVKGPRATAEVLAGATDGGEANHG